MYLITTVLKVMTFGAYHLYVMGEQWNRRQEIHRLQNEEAKAILEEMRRMTAINITRSGSSAKTPTHY